MAGTRDKEKSGGGSFYAWSNIHHGGETEMRPRQNNMMMKVVTERNVVAHGEKVTQAELGVTDEEWEGLIDSGSVRPYPVPEGTDEYTSPHKAVMDTLVGPDGEVDVDKVMALQNLDAIVTSTPIINPPAKDEAELPAGA